MRWIVGVVLAGCTSTPPPDGIVVAANQDTRGLAIDATNLYWVTIDGNVMAMPLDGSSDPIALVSGITTRPISIAIDASYVYWSNLGNAAGPGAVMKVPIGGGAPVELAPDPTPGRLAVSADTVYWATANDFEIASVPKDGGTVSTFLGDGVSVEIGGFAVDATHLYWNQGGPQQRDLAGGALIALGLVPYGVGTIAVDATRVYWTVGPLPSDVTLNNMPAPVEHGGYVMKTSIGGGPLTQLATFETPSYPVVPIAVDSDHVYWLGATEVLRTGLDGGTIETLAAHEGDPYALVLGDTDVYWASGPVDGEPPAIRKLAK